MILSVVSISQIIEVRLAMKSTQTTHIFELEVRSFLKKLEMVDT